MTKLLIIGGSGFVGYNFARFFAPRNQVLLTYLTSAVAPDVLRIAQTVQLDIRDADAVLSTLTQILPKVVIHAAGNKNVKHCETHPDDAYQINAIGTQNIARACRHIGAHLIYISSDLVFDSIKGGFLLTDTPKPHLVYGKTKLQGEILARQELENMAICRTGGVYGKKSPLLDWLNTELRQGHTVECFTDVFNTPTYADNLSEMISAIIKQEMSGIFHTVGRERVNRFQFFQTYARVFDFNVDLLIPASAGESRAKMLLQPDSSLSIDSSSQKLGVKFNSVAEGLARLKASEEAIPF